MTLDLNNEKFLTCKHLSNTQNQTANDTIHRVISAVGKSWWHDTGWCPVVQLVCNVKLAVLAFLAPDVSARHAVSSCIAESLQRRSSESSVLVGTSLSLSHELLWWY